MKNALDYEKVDFLPALSGSTDGFPYAVLGQRQPDSFNILDGERF